MAIEKGNADIVKLLLTNNKIDINIKSIFLFVFMMIFQFIVNFGVEINHLIIRH